MVCAADERDRQIRIRLLVQALRVADADRAVTCVEPVHTARPTELSIGWVDPWVGLDWVKQNGPMDNSGAVRVQPLL